MFLKCTGNRPGDKTVGYYKVVESYRDEDNRNRHRILLNLGPISHLKADRLKRVLEADRNPTFVATDIEDILIHSHKEYLGVMALYHYWQEWGLNEFFEGFNYVVPMVINRCLNPKSKIGVTKWVRKTVLPTFFNTSYEEIDPFCIYRELDQLNELEGRLQQHLCQFLEKRGDIRSQAFFYDITSTYFEGKRCLLCKFGYSRDHRSHRKQIVIALMITKEGFPFHWKVLPGTTQDVTTIAELAQVVKKKLNLQDCTLVFDRGMVSEDNLDQLRDNELNFVTALDRNQIKGLELFDLSSLKTIDWGKPLKEQLYDYQEFDKNLYYQEKSIDNSRYILGFNPLMYQDELSTLQEKVKEIEDYIKDKNKDLAQAKKSRSKEVLIREIDKKLKSKKLHKIIEYQILPKEITCLRKNGSKRKVRSFQVTHRVNNEKFRKRTHLFGLGCFLTELGPERLSTKNLISTYHYKYLIEKSLRTIKDTIKLRPIYLTRDERVKAHVSICVLAYLLLASLEHKILETDIDLSVSEILEELSECKVNTMEIKGQDMLTKNISEPTELQRRIAKELECGYLLEKKNYKKYIEKKEDEGM